MTTAFTFLIMILCLGFGIFFILLAHISLEKSSSHVPFMILSVCHCAIAAACIINFIHLMSNYLNH
jgi:cytochrome bd-type quinol oxidase subunit 1